MAEPRIRPARSEEAGALGELAFRSKAVWGYGADFMERCRPLLRVAPEQIAAGHVFVADVAGRVAGFYTLASRGAALEVGLLFVEPDLLGRGIGRVLLAHAASEARARGHDELLIESDPGAEGFYRRAGARRLGSVPSPAAAGRELPLLSLPLASVGGG